MDEGANGEGGRALRPNVESLACSFARASQPTLSFSTSSCFSGWLTSSTSTETVTPWPVGWISMEAFIADLFRLRLTGAFALPFAFLGGLAGAIAGLIGMALACVGWNSKAFDFVVG